LKIFLALTFLLGFTFVYFQAMEYHEAYTELGLQLGTGIYGSTFFMLTGFHGMHVTLGAIMLTVIWLRVMKGLSPRRGIWIRSRRLVLALRRRGLARPVYLRLLAVARHHVRRMDPSAVVGDEQQQEQRRRQADAPGQGLDHLGAVVRCGARQVEQSFAQADQNSAPA